MARVITKETILQELEGLAEEQIPEVLDFIRFLKFKGKMERRPAPDVAALRILAELDRIRQEMEARYGVYTGDPVREVREMRERQMEAPWKPSS
ncbi:MAG TPA: hypothetical protein VNK89_12045 [Thermoflexus sp.]|nr:hypothetical protein [Thermoflexus sp.]